MDEDDGRQAASSSLSPTIRADGAHILVTVQVADVSITVAKRNLEHFDGQDPYFFDSGYTVAGSTGFLLWEANWLLLELLRGELAGAVRGRRVLELGCGTGLAGLCAAALGAHVLLTDLLSVVHGIVDGNIARNVAPQQRDVPPDAAAPAAPGMVQPPAAAPAPPLRTCGSPAATQAATAAAAGHADAAVSGPWHGARPVGHGSAAALPLDWTEPMHAQVQSGNDPRDAEIILALDTIWLKEIFHCFADTVLEVLRHKARPAPCVCYLAFVERAAAGSQLFVPKEAVEAEFRARGCAVECLVAKDVLVDGQPKAGRVLRIALTDGGSGGG